MITMRDVWGAFSFIHAPGIIINLASNGGVQIISDPEVRGVNGGVIIIDEWVTPPKPDRNGKMWGNHEPWKKRGKR